MFSPDDSNRAQAAVFCDELHRHIEQLDLDAEKIADKIRTGLGRRGPARRSAAIAALQHQLKEAGAERRRVTRMLAALGHPYPCGDCAAQARA
jgi:hypothetical protein